MKTGTTEIVFILDRSGSMAALTEDTIGGFNAMLEQQKQEPGEALVSTLLFNHTCTVLHDRLPLERIPAMTRQDYLPAGQTALLDAVGGAIRHIRNIHKYARQEDVPERTMFIITTDGMENASRQYTGQAVRQMIAEQKAEGGWEFLFLGANMDAVETARKLNIDEGRAVRFRNDRDGVRLNYQALTRVIHDFRCGAAVCDDWKADIERDHRQRK